MHAVLNCSRRCLVLHARLGAETARQLLAQRPVSLRPVGEPDALDLMGEARVGERVDPSVDEPLLPCRVHGAVPLPWLLEVVLLLDHHLLAAAVAR